MTDPFVEGDAILFMKVGTHAQEDLGDIIARKRQEIEDAGFSMWGYGGNTCHPTSMVQPFARSAHKPNPIRLVMQPVNSRHFAEPVRAEEFSVDGLKWEQIPEPINVLGSRYALCIASLTKVDEVLDLASTEVAVGNSRGRAGTDYLKGRVDKACLRVAPNTRSGSRVVEIGLVAELVEPYAVFLRS